MHGAGVGLGFTAQVENAGGERQLVLRPALPPAERTDDCTSFPVRVRAAALWALQLDAQFRELLQAGASVRIAIPHRSSFGDSRPIRETLTEYRGLRLQIGALIYPLLLDRPSLKPLYDFQQRGVQWLKGIRGGILADDMGLGKTVQAISAIRMLFHNGDIRSALVMCPRGLIATWEGEIERWAPELGVAVVVPPARIREDAWAAIAGRRHVLLTNYEHLRHVPRALVRNPPDVVIADEAHRLKNRQTQAARGGSRLAPKRFWALSGTPLERDLEDLATLLALVAPAAFAPSDSKLHPSSLRSRAADYVLRRRKTDVLDQLPPVLDSTERVELTDDQRETYENEVAQHARRGNSSEELALLSRLQTVCDMEPETRQSSKIDRIVELLDGIRKQGEKAVVFSYRLDPLKELQRRITLQWGTQTSCLLVGAMDIERRSAVVRRFRKDNSIMVLLASSRIGGEGLTLIEANHVFLFNQWWNPSANDQARDRVVRIGQRRKVRVYRFCCRATVEETIGLILKRKRALFADTVEKLAIDDNSGWSELLREVGLGTILAMSTEHSDVRHTQGAHSQQPGLLGDGHSESR